MHAYIHTHTQYTYTYRNRRWGIENRSALLFPRLSEWYASASVCVYVSMDGCSTKARRLVAIWSHNLWCVSLSVSMCVCMRVRACVCACVSV